MKRYWLWLILVIGFCFRVFRVNIPENYIFDEVYHVPSIRAFSQNNPEAFDVYAQAPEPGTAYDWLHPPLAKLIQAGSALIFGDNSFGWRFSSVLFGALATFGVYYLAISVTKNRRAALLAAAIFSLDNLQLVMSRIAMNDIFVTAFILFALAFFFKKNWLWCAVFTGLAVSTKHSAILLYPIFLLQVRNLKFLKFRTFGILFFLPPLIYLFSFSQFWLQGHSWQQFVDLHRQIYYYQTHLKATHPYQSAAWQWPLLLRPVWFHVQNLSDKVANIYNLGNPMIFWLGLVALLQGLSLQERKDSPYRYLVFSYLGLWLPFLFSPRIMFLHHYLPALSVLIIILALWLGKLPKRPRAAAIVAIAVSFVFFYPISTAIALPVEKVKYWFWLKSWR